MYVPSYEYPDRKVMNAEGRCFGGVPIGIILFGVAGYTLPPGSVENATTFKYPVHFHAIPAASITNVVQPTANSEVLDQVIEAGKFLVGQGCRAIVGGCGYFANYLPQIKDAIDVPCIMSSVMQVPLIQNTISSRKKVAIICANGEVMPKAKVLDNCGVDRSRIVIAGGVSSNIPEMTDEILHDSGGYNPKKLEREMVALAASMVKEDPSIGAFMLECTLYPAVSYAVQKEVRMPVFDFVTLIDWVYSGVVKHPYYGYI